MLENETTVTRDVGALLFVKDDGQWRIAAQASAPLVLAAP
jgi:hypothetical protein